MQTIFDEISRIEASAKKYGISMKLVCEEAGIDRSTLTRWKNETSYPRLDQWERFLSSESKIPAIKKKKKKRENA